MLTIEGTEHACTGAGGIKQRGWPIRPRERHPVGQTGAVMPVGWIKWWQTSSFFKRHSQFLAVLVRRLERLGGTPLVERTLKLSVGPPRISDVRLSRGLAGVDQGAQLFL
jgi:hypothetical protein